MSLERTTHDGERKDPSPSSYEFTHAATKSAVAQICETVGYNQFKDPPLESLTGFAIQYILQLGKIATSFANLNGRSQCNVFDIVLALEDLSDNVEEERVSLDSCSALRSVKLREIINFVKINDEEEKESPFLQTLPRFPLSDKRKMMIKVPSFVEVGEIPPGKHIPLWLPAFPDPHTYKETPMWIERGLDPRGDKIEQARQRRKAERALLSLQRKLVCRISSGGVWGDMDVVGGVKEEIREGESEVVHEEEEKRDGVVSVVEAFAPALEAARDDGVFGEAQWKKKPVALSKLRTEKKFLGEPLDLTLQMKGEDRAMSLREEDRDDKRRRAEFILRQCMENPVDLNQL